MVHTEQPTDPDNRSSISLPQNNLLYGIELQCQTITKTTLEYTQTFAYELVKLHVGCGDPKRRRSIDHLADL